MLSKWKWTGHITITVRDLNGVILEVVEKENLITTVAFNMIRDVLAGDVSDGEIKRMALGDDNTAPALADTILGNETSRYTLTSSTKPSAGQWRSVFYVFPASSVAQIEEIGWFAGAAAGAGADSGILVAHILYSRLKTNLESIQVERLDTLEEA